MATFHLTVTDESRHPLNGVIIESGEYNTSPCPGWPNTGNCTSGSGTGWNGTTDSTGTINTDIPYTCVGLWSGTLKSQGYDDFPYSYQSGSITGDIWDTVQMVQNESQSGNPSTAPSNNGGNAYAGSLSNQLTATTVGTSNSITTQLSALFGGQTAGIPNWIIMIIAAVVAIILIVALRRRKA